MPSGGARARSGPAPDPNALRRDRKDDAAWVTLPVEGYAGAVPEWPFSSSDLAGFEAVYWNELWRKPQAIMWAKLDMARQVASYVRAFAEAAEPKASAGLKTAVLRMEGELGLSLPGMNSFRWKFSEDELAAKRDVSARPSGARARLAALGDS